MAKYEDYVAAQQQETSVGGLTDEINDAQQQTQARPQDPETGQFVATPEKIDWEKRYQELEKHNSRQAQDLGTYRKMVDDYIISPTPASQVVEKAAPITADDLYDNPAEAIERAVEAHPAIQEARQLQEQLQKREQEGDLNNFKQRHPDYAEIGADPEFRNWVGQSPMRQDMYARGNDYDLSAADALFSLYKAENNIAQMTSESAQQRQIQAANLEDSSSIMVNEAPKYSRSEYVDTLMRARQGDLDADRWVKRNAEGYRLALGSGNVRD